ncbi:leucine Rich Repeat domain-containing protein [Ascosphaera apis ARSEF 7405]|uniref:Leucine Rich Repeat domain-containing protein n=1 Tax=Ascosphaera apis ARSEF 7405 TaxID=392613 RepID=A0A166N857_9EURO|nr:leucine Rich Repeat domain-containing protein [Ascosphaera apis ARSEF 7405]
MEKLDTKDGYAFIKGLEEYVRKHEPQIAGSQEQTRRFSQCSVSGVRDTGMNRARSSSTLAAAWSLAAFPFVSTDSKEVTVTLTPNELFYLLSRFDELDVDVGPMNIRLENINNEQSSAYVSFLNKPRRFQAGDKHTLRSVSSVHRAMSAVGSYFSSFGFSSRGLEKAKIEHEALTYLYSSFTKIPSLKLVSDHAVPLIHGYEEFPFDTAVPLYAFHNLHTLHVTDTDFRSFYGWDRLAERLTNLTLNRANLEDLDDLLTGIVLDDFDRRRRRSTKTKYPASKHATLSKKKPLSQKTSPIVGSPGCTQNQVCQGANHPSGYSLRKAASEYVTSDDTRDSSSSPHRPGHSHRHSTSIRHRGNSYHKMRRSRSGSSQSSEMRKNSITGLMVNVDGVLVPKWQRLAYLSLADNNMSSIRAAALSPVANSLRAFDLSHNQFTEIPESLSSLPHLRSLNMSYCQISSLRSLDGHPAPAITTLRLRGNSLQCLSGIERLTSLERLDLRDNNITDPMELICLTYLPKLREIWISGNPFTKTYSGHRVTIFNLFRRTPGFHDDIVIDKEKPNYAEKKHLVDRVGEGYSGRLSQSLANELTGVLHMISKHPNSSSEEHIPTMPFRSSGLTAKPTVKRRSGKENFHDQDQASSDEGLEMSSKLMQQSRRHTIAVQGLQDVKRSDEHRVITKLDISTPLNHDGACHHSNVYSETPLTSASSSASILSQMTHKGAEPVSPTSYYGPCPSNTSNNGTSGTSTTLVTPIDSPGNNGLIPAFNEIHWGIADKRIENKQLVSLAPEFDDNWASMLKENQWNTHHDDMNVISVSPTT